MKFRLLASASLLLCLFISRNASAQKDSMDTTRWKAHWIDVPGQSKDYEYCLFRKTINVASKPASFVVKVAGDNRYKLFVNGQQVSLGPARGDYYYWNYETVDLAPYLQAGDNVLSAIVVNEGSWRPVSQMSYGTGFILQGATPAEETANTNRSWKCLRDTAYRPLDVVIVYSYYVAGPGELVDMKLQPKNWQMPGFDDSTWPQANRLGRGWPKGQMNFDDGRELVPSPIPAREMVMQRLGALRKADGVNLPSTFPAQPGAVTIPANTKATILLDQTYLTNAYPTIIFSKGKGAGISMSYAEGLYIIEPAVRIGARRNERVIEMRSRANDLSAARTASSAMAATNSNLRLSIGGITVTCN